MSANRSASQILARYPPASEAPWPPSFQPRKAAIRTGSRRLGRSTMRSSSAIGEVYVRPEEQRRKGDGADPDGRRQEDVRQHETPRQMRPPLQLSQPHLDEQQPEDCCAELEETRRTFAASSEVAEAEDEGQ